MPTSHFARVFRDQTTITASHNPGTRTRLSNSTVFEAVENSRHRQRRKILVVMTWTETICKGTIYECYFAGSADAKYRRFQVQEIVLEANGAAFQLRPKGSLKRFLAPVAD